MQDQVIAFLSAPEAYGADGPVEIMKTHISIVFLAGNRAYKLKRAVKFPYVDYSSVALRQSDCEKEIALNRLTAPHLYLGVRTITREADGSFAFEGRGETVDAVVEMVRFAQDDLFDQMAASGRLTSALMEELAREAAQFHQKAPVVHQGGGADNIAGVLDINRGGFATSTVFSDAEVAAFDARFRKGLEAHRPLLDKREADGKVRRCHGDLHLRNICLVNGQPLVFDCIEFNDQIATIDVLYDLAFLLMDLWHRDLPGFANLIANRYLDRTGDDEGFVLLPYFMALRAAVRAHVTATQAENSTHHRSELAALARAYFELALDLLHEREGRLIAVGGFSGSGKSSVAEALAPMVAPAPGARVLESDRIRKALFKVAADTRLPDSAYAREVSDKVYEALGARGSALADRGAPVIVDAVFSDPIRRGTLEKQAAAQGLSVAGFWLDAEPAVLRERVAERADGVSDATLAVLDSQVAGGHGDLSWARIDAGQPVVESAREIARSLSRTGATKPS